MKILQVAPRFSPMRGGGGVTVIYELSKALAQRKHEVVIYTSDFELDQNYINSLDGVSVCSFHGWLNLATLHITPSMVTETKKRLKDFDIIHMQGCRTFQNIVVYYYAKKYDIPYVIDAHGFNLGHERFSRRMPRQFFDIAFSYRMLRHASRVIAETKVGVNEYKKAGVSEGKIVLIYPPRDLEEFRQLPPRGRFRNTYNIKEKHIIMFLGGIDWVKGVDFLVDSFHKLAQYRDDIILVIVGPDWGNKADLENLIDELKLSGRVIFTGFLAGQEKLSALVDADMMVLPSRYEQGLPYAALEAIMCNTPVIVTKNTGAGEDAARMDAGYLVEFGATDELCKTMQYVLDNPTETASKTRKAKEYIEVNLSMPKKIMEYEKLYLQCIEGNKSANRSKR